MVMGLKIWSLSNPGFEPATFRSLTQRSNQPLTKKKKKQKQQPQQEKEKDRHS
jgi:hypothetical protein